MKKIDKQKRKPAYVKKLQSKLIYMRKSKKELVKLLLAPKPEPVSFARQLAVKLCESNLGDVKLDHHSDNSGSWVDLRIGNKVLSISFDMEGEKIWRVGVWKDIIKVVDTEMIFGEKSK